MGPANHPDFYTKCPSKNILQVGRSVIPLVEVNQNVGIIQLLNSKLEIIYISSRTMFFKTKLSINNIFFVSN